VGRSGHYEVLVNFCGETRFSRQGYELMLVSRSVARSK
jgi:hypothetical protein